MCAAPEAVADEIRALAAAARRSDPAPAHPREELRRGIDGHGPRHFARLRADDLAVFNVFNRVFRAHEDVLAHFGYQLME